MRTRHKKSTLSTNIGLAPMTRFLETFVYDLYNSEYKTYLGRNVDRADAVIMVQDKFWEEWQKSGRDLGAVVDGYGLRDGKIARLEKATNQKDVNGGTLDISKLGNEVAAPPREKRKRDVTEEEDERDLKRQRITTEGPLATNQNSLGISVPEKHHIEAHISHLTPYFLPPPSAKAPRAPSTRDNIALPSPQQSKPRARPALINRERRCIAQARSYLQVLVRNSRADYSRNGYEEEAGYSSDDTDTETYNDEDSAVLLGLRLNPINTSNVKEIIDEVAENEAILKAEYRATEVKKIAQEYEAGLKRLVKTLVDVVPWEVGMKIEDEAKRLVDEVLRF